MKNEFNLIRFALTILLLTAPITLSYAQVETKSNQHQTSLSMKEVRAILIDSNNQLKDAFKLIPTKYGIDPAAEKISIQKAQAVVSKITKEVKGEYKVDEQGFKMVQNNIKRLSQQLDAARKLNDVGILKQEIESKHKKNQAADPILIKKYQDSVKNLEAIKSNGFKSTTNYLSKHSKQLLIQNEEWVAKASGASESAKIQEETQETKKLIEQAKIAFSDLMNQIESSDSPLDDLAFSASIAAANSFAEKNPFMMKAYMGKLRHLRIMNSFLESDKKQRAQKVAQHLEGGKIKSGFARSKSLIMNFKVEADWCYALVTRDTDTQKREVEIRSTYWKKIIPTLLYTIVPESQNLYRYDGFCVNKNNKVNAKAYLSEKSKDIKYVVVGWPRNETPRWLFQNANLEMTDSCDPKSFLSRFEEPLPGSLTNYNGSLHQIMSFAKDTGHVTLLNIAGNEKTVAITDIYEKKDNEVVMPKYRFKVCPYLKDAKGKLSVKYGKCIEKVEKSFASKLKKAERKVKYAKTDSKREKAEEKLVGIEEKVESKKEKKCSSIKDSIMEEGRQTFESLKVLSEAQKSLPRPSDRIKQAFEEIRIEREIKN